MHLSHDPSDGPPRQRERIALFRNIRPPGELGNYAGLVSESVVLQLQELGAKMGFKATLALANIHETPINPA